MNYCSERKEIMFKKKEEKQQTQQDKNFVLIVKYECGESGFLTNQADLPLALQEYNDVCLKQLEGYSKYFSLPFIKEAKLYRLFKS